MQLAEKSLKSVVQGECENNNFFYRKNTQKKFYVKNSDFVCYALSAKLYVSKVKTEYR